MKPFLPLRRLEAEVSYGDTRLDAGRVSTRLESVVGSNGTVRISSAVPVDEPVVSVSLVVGCSQKIARRYVLLAELADPSAEPYRDSQASGFFQTSIQPLSALMSGDASHRPAGDATSLDFAQSGLDIDLCEPTRPSTEFMGTGATDPLPPVRADLLDFDLPDADTQERKPKKPR